jgi:pyruvate kinase
MNRRTKIVCTLGPASADAGTVRDLAVAGMDVARLNFSHGTHDGHRRAIDLVREAATATGRTVAVMQDLQGPKIRVGRMPAKGIPLEAGQRLVLTSRVVPPSEGSLVHIDYPTLADDVTEGSVILLDDGRLELRILEVQERDVVTEVVVGGTLHSRKGVNLPNIRTSTPALTPKDLEDLSLGLELGVDFVALSFVRDESDVANLVSRVRESGHRTGIIAKIEKPEAVERIDAIIDQSDGIMVARGDLGIEMRLSKVPGTQKRIIRKCQVAARPVITATQMLESMIENARPTRAEVSDVANAVLDGSDAVMLSGETAMGRHPVRVVEVMATIIEEAERHYREMGVIAPEDQSASDLTESVSFTAVQLATRVDAVAIACLTATGATARAIARHRPRVPLYAFTDDRAVVGRLALTWGTKGFAVPFEYDTDKGIERVHQVLLEHGLARVGDRIVITAGMPLPTRGRTNMVHVSQL